MSLLIPHLHSPIITGMREQPHPLFIGAQVVRIGADADLLSGDLEIRLIPHIFPRETGLLRVQPDGLGEKLRAKVGRDHLTLWSAQRQ